MYEHAHIVVLNPIAFVTAHGHPHALTEGVLAQSTADSLIGAIVQTGFFQGTRHARSGILDRMCVQSIPLQSDPKSVSS